MGMVMIRCPKTRRAISTGIRADRATFHSTPVFFSRRTLKENQACDGGATVATDCGPSCERQVA